MLYSDQKDDSTHDRILCPLDSTHTCFASLLEKHLKKCNARHRESQVYFVRNVNSGSPSVDSSEKITLNDVTDEELREFIARVDAICREHTEEPRRHSSSAGEELREEIERSSGSAVALKHLRQQAALVGLAREHDLFGRNDVCYTEFGAGKGRLSYWIAKSVRQQTCSILLVDRAAARHKFENKLISEPGGPEVERIRIDIEHLCLGTVDRVKKHGGKVVGFCKHLCGEATDFALRCLTAGMEDVVPEGACRVRLLGALMAVCCHHRCRWGSFVGRHHLQSWGISAADFSLLRCLAGWATCARSQEGTRCGDAHGEDAAPSDGRNVRLGLTVAERREVGRRCKLLLDAARVAHLRRLGFDATILYFVAPDVTPENVALLVLPR